MHFTLVQSTGAEVSAQSLCQHVSRQLSDCLKPKRYGRFLYSTRVLGIKSPRTASKKGSLPVTLGTYPLCI
jgi:hypothetical protein